MKPHYHTGMNTVGYMPDEPPATFSTKRKAHAYARSLATSVRRDGFGSWSHLVCHGGNGDDYFCGVPGAATLFLHIWTRPCTDDCKIGEDD